uniref:Major facilitator superfamily (MFS) profile domain-containing protein n=1 Tax=Tetranychus urticae TaxID=32264 RepID=T1KJ05_TETUR
MSVHFETGNINCCNTVHQPQQPAFRSMQYCQDATTRLLPSKHIEPMNRKQICCLIILAYSYFCIAASGSLQAPFFPGQCDIKGVSPLTYGLIFGVFELIVTSMPSIFRKMFAYVTPHTALRFGLFLTGTTTILFGVLDKVTLANQFAGFALLLRIGEGLGVAAFVSSCHALKESEFREHPVPALTALSTASCLGALLGLPIGGALFMAGGYFMPFVVFGSLTLFAFLMSIFILSKSDDYMLIGDPISPGYSDKFVEVFAIAGSVALTGFNDVTLAHHLSLFDLSPIQLASIFMIILFAFLTFPTFCCAFGSNGFGSLWTPIVGTVLIIIGLISIGPASFIPIEPYVLLDDDLWLIILSLIVIGFGLRAKKLSPTSYGCSKWLKALPIIATFVGPVTGGWLISTVGYRTATEVALALEIFTLILLIIHKICNCRTPVEPSF